MRLPRRQALAMVGSTLFAGCLDVRDVAGNRKTSPPKPFLTEPADWEYPQYDAANTNAPPAYAAPDVISQAPEWEAEFTADQFEYHHGPIVADGTAYLALSGYSRTGAFDRLVALDARTGEERWQFSVEGAPYAPMVADETIFWLASVDELHALGPLDGRVRWKQEGANHREPIAAHGLVLMVGGDSRRPRLEALDPVDGRTYWSRREDNRMWNLLAADSESFYATLEGDTKEHRDELHALDPTTGETRWKTSGVSPRTATVRSYRLFASHGPPDAQELLALDVTTQETKWTESRDMQRKDGESLVNGKQSVAAVTDELVLVHLGWRGYSHDRIEAREAGRF